MMGGPALAGAWLRGLLDRAIWWSLMAAALALSAVAFKGAFTGVLTPPEALFVGVGFLIAGAGGLAGLWGRR